MVTFSVALHGVFLVVQRRVGEVVQVVFERHPQRLVLWILVLTVEVMQRSTLAIINEVQV